MSDEEKQIVRQKADAQWLVFVDRMMDTVDIVVNQVTSGRWILTVIAGACLVHFSWAAKDVEEADKIIDIFKDIVIFYFVVRDASKPGDKQAEVKTEVKSVQDPIKPGS